MLLPLKMLIGIPNYWHLTNNQVTIGNPLLQPPILGRVVFRNRRSQDRDGVAARFNRGRVGSRVNAARKPRHYSEFVADEIFCKERGTFKTLKIKQFNGVLGVPQFLRVFAAAMHTHTEMLDACAADRSERESCVLLDVRIRNEVGRHRLLMLAEFLCNRFKPRALSRP